MVSNSFKTFKGFYISNLIKSQDSDMINVIFALIFYKYLSNTLEEHIHLIKDRNLTIVEAYEDEESYKLIKDAAYSELGYFIEFEYLFNNLLYDKNSNMHVDITKLDNALEEFANSKKEKIFENIFDDVNLFSTSIAKTKEDREKIFTMMMRLIKENTSHIEKSFGEYFEKLLYLYSESQGKSSDSLISVKEINELLSDILTFNKKSVDSIYDPFMGCGMSLINIYNKLSVSKIFGQEINPKLYNLARMNLLIHDIKYNQIFVKFDDTLSNPGHLREKFDIIVSDPPIGIKLDLDSDSLVCPERFYGFKISRSRAEYFNILHMLYYLKENGRMAVVVPQGVLFRKSDRDIRKFLIEDNNYLDAIINLPANLLVQTAIPVTILVFEKNRASDEVLFIDASKEFKSQRSRNLLTEENIEKIVNTYKNRDVIDKFSYLASIDEIKNNDFNLTISRYIDTFEGEFIKLEDVLDERMKVNKEYDEVNKEIQYLTNKLKINKR